MKKLFIILKKYTITVYGIIKLNLSIITIGRNHFIYNNNWRNIYNFNNDNNCTNSYYNSRSNNIDNNEYVNFNTNNNRCYNKMDYNNSRLIQNIILYSVPKEKDTVFVRRCTSLI